MTRTDLVVAIDEADVDVALDLIGRTSEHVTWYKVGYEAYLNYGERVVGALHDAGKSIFLDLKLHDIPKTVAAGVRASARMGVSLLTVHAAGGVAMLKAAAAARDESSNGELRLVAVTVLTSMTEDDLRDTGIGGTPENVVIKRAELAAACGIDGAVCAVAEARAVRAATNERFAIVCPGIRPTGATAGDQRRIATPEDAIRAGADFIVVGRPITASTDPGAAALAILHAMEAGRK